jgi:hypothetical protein
LHTLSRNRHPACLAAFLRYEHKAGEASAARREVIARNFCCASNVASPPIRRRAALLSDFSHVRGDISGRQQLQTGLANHVFVVVSRNKQEETCGALRPGNPRREVTGSRPVGGRACSLKDRAYWQRSQFLTRHYSLGLKKGAHHAGASRLGGANQAHSLSRECRQAALRANHDLPARPP